MKKFLNVFAAFVLIVSTILMVPGIGGKVSAASVTQSQITNFSVQYLDSNGAVSGITDAATQIALNYNLNLGNLNANDLTYEFDMYNPTGTPILGDFDVKTNADLLRAGTTEKLGTYSIAADGKVTLNFNQAYTGVLVGIAALTKVNPNYGFEESKEEVQLTLGQKFELQIAFKHGDYKEGKQVGKTIEWKVEVNKGLKNITNAVFTDTLPAGLTLDPSSIQIRQANIQANGGVQPVGNPLTGITPTIDGQQFSLNLGSNASGAYEIKFTTTVDPTIYEQTFKNEATFNGAKASGNADFSRKVVLDKKVKNSTGALVTSAEKGTTNTNQSTVFSDNKIEWEVTINKDGETIPKDATVKDVIAKASGQYNFNVRIDSITIQRINATGSAVETLSANNNYFNLTTSEPLGTAAGNQTIELKFKQDTTERFKITYQTTDSAVGNHYSPNKTRVLNTVDLFGADGEKIADTKRADFYYTKSANAPEVNKKIDVVDYQNQKATYIISVTVPQGNSEQIRIYEAVSNVHTLGTSFIKTIKKDGQPYVDYYLSNYGTSDPKLIQNIHLYSQGSNTVTAAGKYDIEIEVPFSIAVEEPRNTSVDPYYFNNTAFVINENGDFNAGVTEYYYYKNNPYMVNNGFKEGVYDPVTRQIEWEVGFNYNIRSLEKAQIEDILGENQQLVDGSFELYKWNLKTSTTGGNPAAQGYTRDLTPITTVTDWNAVVTKNASNDGFTIDVDQLLAGETKPAAYNEAYVLKYRTSIDDNFIITPTYTNDFKLTYDGQDQEYTDYEFKGTADIPRGAEYVEKSGEYDDRIVNWTVELNATVSDVENLKFVDELSDGQLLLGDTVKVYEASYKPNTLELEKGNELPTTSYNTMANGNTLTLEIPGKITRPYIVEYQSYITAEGGKVLSNEISASGVGFAELTQDAQTADKWSKATATAIGSRLDVGTIKITKTSGKDGSALKGVKFSATYEINEQPFKVYAYTDSDGIAVFKNIPAGAIIVLEEQTLPGYALDSKPRTANVADGEVEEETYVNYPETTVTLTKADEVDSSIKLPGAVFKLQKKDGNVYKDVDVTGDFIAQGGTAPTFTTSSDSAMFGQIVIKDLPFGDYQFVEVNAPTGYDPAGPFGFVINKDNVNVSVSAPNKSSANGTKVTLTKFDQADANEKLEGAKFKLQKKEGTDYKDVDETGQFVTPAPIFTTTADSGQIVIENLPFGDYQFIETDAPTGYELDETPRQFSLTETSKSANVLAPNKKVTTTGVITLTKVDEDDPNKRLPDATFKLQQEENGAYVDVAGYDNLVTDANGQIVLKDLPFGNFQLVETVAPTGYSKDETPVKFMLSNGNLTDSKTMTNKQTPKTPGSIEILKVDGNDTTKPLAGAEFDLILADGTTVKVGPTDASGKATITDIPVGSHQLKETKAPEGYVLTTNALAITVSEGAKTTQTVTNFAEPQPVGALELLKVDATTKASLSGAEFMLSNGSMAYKIGPTNANGVAKLSNIPVGTYTLTEVKAPEGYEMKAKEIVVTIAKDTTTPLTVENVKLPPPAPTTGELKIIKVDAGNKAFVLPGAVFTVTDGDMTKMVTTNSAGEAILTGLTPGAYVITELQAPTGYVLNSTPRTVKVEAGKTATFTFENVKEIELGSLQVTKVDSTNSNTKLAGAQFDLIAADGKVLKVGPTDANGVAKLNNIPVGTYQLKETVAPTGYTLSTEEVTVAIGKGATASVTVRNDKVIPKTGIFRLTKVDAADSSIRLGGATFTLTNGDKTHTVVTDVSGLGLVTDLEPGNYILTETVAPTGYVLNEKSVIVKIVANEVTEHTFSNTKKPVTPNPNPNGEDPNNGTNPDSGTNPKPNPNGENPNSGTNPDSGTKPKDPNSLTPNTGTKPSTGTNTGKTPIVTPNNTGGTSGTNTTNKKPTLPQTNGESTMVYTLLGLLLVAGSTAILIARRRKTN